MKFIYFVLVVICLSFVCADNTSVTKLDAQTALNDSLTILNEFSSVSFPVSFINDTYSDASLAFQQAVYAEILGDNSIPENDSQKVLAKSALKFVNLKDINYAGVILYADKIKQHKIDAYNIYDSLNLLGTKVDNYAAGGMNVSVARGLLSSANKSFYLDQFNDSLTYLDKTTLQLESDSEQLSSISVLAENAKNFFYRYWYLIISILIILLIIAGIFIIRIRRYLLKEKINKMEIEEKVLMDLIKKNQTERFKEAKISGLVYNIRVKKYEERLSEIRQELPVLKANLIKNKIKAH